MTDHSALHTPRTRDDGTPNHYQEAQRLLALSDEVSTRSPEGAHAIAAQAQVHATLHLAEITQAAALVATGEVSPEALYL